MNNQHVADAVIEASKSMLGTEKVSLMTNQCMGAEDFAFVSSEVPSCIYFVAMNKDSH
jgi:metal-dependent amidase/aminoacylase/carboxypeptidase family protein